MINLTITQEEEAARLQQILAACDPPVDPVA